LLPKAVVAGVIVIAGVWVGRYLGRSALIWACNEGVPHPRIWSGVVRMLITCVAIAAAAEHLHFAPVVFLTVLIVAAAGVMLAAPRLLSRPEAAEEKSLWNHL
jgi:hypothetical protein